MQFKISHKSYQIDGFVCDKKEDFECIRSFFLQLCFPCYFLGFNFNSNDDAVFYSYLALKNGIFKFSILNQRLSKIAAAMLFLLLKFCKLTFSPSFFLLFLNDNFNVTFLLFQIHWLSETDVPFLLGKKINPSNR